MTPPMLTKGSLARAVKSALKGSGLTTVAQGPRRAAGRARREVNKREDLLRIGVALTGQAIR